MKKLLQAIVVLLLTISSTKTTTAIYDPLAAENNKYGIHILNENDLQEAKELVNSSGGEWGYVTIVIRSDERNINRWQRTFDEMREKKLIPIIRIATKQTSNGWEKFSEDDIKNWVYFLNSLNWVIENRYVIIGNEPNHATEWGGEVNPEEYSDYLLKISQALKSASEDFFILPAGFDASAPNGSGYMSEEVYLQRMLNKNPEILDNIDGWASHSYPNPGFSGSVNDTGRGTIRTYEWELEYLKSLGVGKDLPVFITETGWVHNKGAIAASSLNRQYIGENYKTAYEQVWSDNRIVAITPFILNYQNHPFNIFSWKDKEGVYYDFYFDIQKLSKQNGKPAQRDKATINSIIIPNSNNQNKNLSGFALIENTGQKIWEEDEIKLLFENNIGLILESSTNKERVKPGKQTIIFFNLTTTRLTGSEKRIIFNVANGNSVISSGYRMTYQTNLNSNKISHVESKPRFEDAKVMLPIVYFYQVRDDIPASI